MSASAAPRESISVSVLDIQEQISDCVFKVVIVVLYYPGLQ